MNGDPGDGFVRLCLIVLVVGLVFDYVLWKIT